MNASKQLNQLNQKIIQSKTAFKKNKQNFNSINIPSMVTSRNDLSQIKQSINTNLSSLTATKKASTQVYESVVNHLKLLLEEAYTKNEFLVRDRAQVLKQNEMLKLTVQEMKVQLEEARSQITEMKLNAGAEVKGLMKSGKIFEVMVVGENLTGNQSERRDQCRQVVQHGDYSIGQVGQQKSGKRNNNSVNQQQRSSNNNTINQSPDQNSNYHQSSIQSPNSPNHPNPSPSPSSQQSQSLLIRQQSQQLLHPTPQNILSPSPQSQVFSNQMNTPNYNFKETFELDNFNINRLGFRGHFVDVKPGIISYDNSCQGSGNGGRLAEGDCYDKEEKRNRNNQVEISLNGLMNNGNNRREHQNYDDEQQHQHSYQQIDPRELYLNINPDRILLKQEIQTFKQHLRGNNEQTPNSNNSNNHNDQLNNKQQHDSSLRTSNQYKPQAIISCLSTCPQGVFRAFYMNLMQYPLYRQSLRQILQQLQTDDTFILFKLYPKNQLWIQLLNGFLNFIQVKKPSYEQLITHFNQHKFVDVLMCQLLKYKVEFLYNLNIGDGVGGMLNDSDVGSYTRRSNTEEGQNVNVSCTNKEGSYDGNGYDDERSNSDCDSNRYDANSNCNGYEANNEQSLQIAQQQSAKSSAVNQSVHQNTTLLTSTSKQPIKQIHQVFNALAFKFNLSYSMSQTGFQFYQSQAQDDTQPIFTIYLNQQTHSFMFNFLMHYQQSHQCSQQIDNSQQLNRYENSAHRPFQEINLTPGLNQYHNESQNQGQSEYQKQVSPKYKYYASGYDNGRVNNIEEQIKFKLKYHQGSYYEDNQQQQEQEYQNRNFISQTNYNQDQSQELIQQLRIRQNHVTHNTLKQHPYTYPISQNTSYHFNTTPNSLQNTQHSLFPSNKTSQLQTVAGSFNNLSKDLECRQLRQRNINYNMCLNSPIEEELLQNYQSKQLLSGKFRGEEYDFSGHSSILASNNDSGQVSRVVDNNGKGLRTMNNLGNNCTGNNSSNSYNSNNYNSNYNNNNNNSNNYNSKPTNNSKKGRYPLHQKPTQTIYDQNYISRKIHSIQSDNDDHAIYQPQSSNKKYVQNHIINRLR